MRKPPFKKELIRPLKFMTRTRLRPNSKQTKSKNNMKIENKEALHYLSKYRKRKKKKLLRILILY